MTGFLGVIGGMGPLATADFLRKLAEETPAARDQDHVPVLVWGDCAAPDRTAALVAGASSPLDALLKAAEGLRNAGSLALVMPCNTAHAWAAAIAAQSARPLLHIAEAVADEASRAGIKTLGLMATRGTVAAGFYGPVLARHGVALVLPDDGVQQRIDLGIADVKAGRVDTARTRFAAAHAALTRAGAESCALACTEIPVAFDDGGVRTIDTSRALAKAAVRWWMNHAA